MQVATLDRLAKADCQLEELALIHQVFDEACRERDAFIQGVRTKLAEAIFDAYQAGRRTPRESRQAAMNAPLGP